MDSYHKGAVIGQGGSSKVYRGVHKQVKSSALRPLTRALKLCVLEHPHPPPPLTAFGSLDLSPPGTLQPPSGSLRPPPPYFARRIRWWR